MPTQSCSELRHRNVEMAVAIVVSVDDGVVTTLKGDADSTYMEYPDPETYANRCVYTLERIQNAVNGFLDRHGQKIKYAIYAVLLAAYFAYFFYAMTYELGSESSVRLLWMTLLGVFIAAVTVIKGRYGDQIYTRIISPPVLFVEKHFFIFKV